MEKTTDKGEMAPSFLGAKEASFLATVSPKAYLVFRIGQC